MIKSYKSLFFIFLSIFGISILLMVLLFSFLLFKCKESNKYEQNVSTYGISHFNIMSNKTSYGFIKAPSKIFKNKDFITFRTKNNEIFSVISSKFSNKEFECYGFCFCNNIEDKERRTVNILSKSLYFIISAFSLSFAVKIADAYFSEECFNSLKNICSDENIEKEINFCESVSKYGAKGEHDYDPISGELVPSSKETEMIEGEIEKEEKYEGFEREFHCEGHCTPNGNLKREETKYESEKFGCEKYTTDGKVTIIETGKLGFIGDEKYDGNMKAKVKFGSEYLTPYCRSISKYKYEYVYTYPNGKTQVMKGNVNLCVGTEGDNRQYRNICCTLLDPFSTWDGRREKEKINQEKKM